MRCKYSIVTLMPLSMALSGVILSPVASTHFMRTHADTETETEKMKEERWRGYTHTLPEVFFLAVTDDQAQLWL